MVDNTSANIRTSSIVWAFERSSLHVNSSVVLNFADVCKAAVCDGIQG